MIFYLDRTDVLSAPAHLPRKVSEYVQRHVAVTPSGIFSQWYLRWALEVLGPERILCATDYPFAHAAKGALRSFLDDAKLNQESLTLIASGNWERLCNSILR